MNKIIKHSSCIFFILVLLATKAIFAHQPRIVESDNVEIKNFEVSQAFYGELKGVPAEFHIQAKEAFKLYVGLLIPAVPNASKDVSAEIYRVKDGKNERIALLDGNRFVWTPFFEEYVKDNYFWGPEYKADDSIKEKILKGRDVPAGDYYIKVFSHSNRDKYVLVTGFVETFPFIEILKATISVPRIKAQFFGYPFSVMIASPYVWGYLIVIYVLSFVFGFIYRMIVKKLAKRKAYKAHKNIGTIDRIFRLFIGIGLFLWAVMTSWSPLLLFFSGFAIFEAFFSWCAFYAAIGKNNCPIR
jgi:hypothetical protein